MGDLEGRTLGHYRIVERLGAGGMGEVYRAHDERLDRDVAIKVLPEEVAGDPDRMRRFEREAKALAALNHPNIATVYGLESDADADADSDAGVGTSPKPRASSPKPFLVMELLEGESLREVISSERLTVAKAIEYARAIADGLAAAHDRGIIHRDLKPENVFLTRDGRIKILDFGLAKLRQPEMEAGTETPTASMETAEGAVMGTVPYMAPEQVRGEVADHRADIFALGCVLYEMLAGHRPFGGGTSAEISAAILREDPEPLPETVPDALRKVIGRCLEKRPEDRFDSAHDLSLTLGALNSAASVPPSHEASFVRRRWPHLLAIAIAAAIALLVILPPEALFDRVTGMTETQPIRSIAILPLENLTGDPDQQYFVDGLHEELIATFARISAFDKVIARTSVMGFRDTDTQIREIGRLLDVDVLLEGSVRRSGDVVRATLQLIDAETEDHLWAKSFDRSLTDILSLQSEMAEAVTREVNVSLRESEKGRLAPTKPVNLEAYDAYLMGNHLVGSGLVEDEIVKGIGFYQLAIEKDPDFARAHAGLARANCVLANRFRLAAEVMPTALASARTAVQLDDGLGEAHAVLGVVKFNWQWDWDGAESEFRRALELEPNNINARRDYSQLLSALRRNEEAVTNQQRAIELSPLSRRARCDLGWVYFFTGQNEAAVALLTDFIQQYPDEIWGRLILSWAYSGMGRVTDGLKTAEKARDLHPAPLDDPFVIMSLANAYGYAHEYERADDEIKRLLELRRAQYVPPSFLAYAYGAVDDVNGAVVWWQRAFEERHGHVALIRIFLDLKPKIKADPRIRAIVESLNFPEDEP
jgi:serine/threonine-protein kinase